MEGATVPRPQDILGVGEIHKRKRPKEELVKFPDKPEVGTGARR